ncbi:MAG: TetR family transcriptional regulator [Actinomycetaceae bacterium]|nr:TetR family transcriptional regulator [Actinomycetaceae bacterium]
MTQKNEIGKARRRLGVAERRQAILAAASEVFARASYAQAKIADVSERSGASQALVFHYFGSKAMLYAAVVEQAIDGLVQAQQREIEALGEGASAGQRVRVSLAVYLEYIASHPQSWAAPLRGGAEPGEVIAMRWRAREGYVETLKELLGIERFARHHYAVWGYFGFLDGACLAWVDAGCPRDEVDSLIEAALGALEGGLGDYRLSDVAAPTP